MRRAMSSFRSAHDSSCFPSRSAVDLFLHPGTRCASWKLVPHKWGMRGSELRRLLITLVSLAHFGAPLGQRKPRRFVTFNPCKPCPHMVFCSSVCRSTAPPPSRFKRRAKKKNHSLTLLLSFVGAQEKFAEIFSRRLLGARSPFLRCGNRLKRRPTCVLPLNEL